ncbi:MAG: glycosyltransferase family 2 protein [Oscillospiraceae bacterium]|nr:glycosyltransferase family 2 protein [Oscillospiraceae bacterium]
MIDFLREFLYVVSVFYIIYLILFATFSFFSILIGAYRLYVGDRIFRFKNKFDHDDLPVSVLIPAYNESVTIIDSVRSLLNLDYQQYEIIVVDDGSADDTTQKLIDEFEMERIDRPISRELKCHPEEAIYENIVQGVPITLIRKENGGKGDALNMGINASRYPYFVCMDADSRLQKNSLKEIVEPVFEDDTIVAVGGMILISQCMQMEDGEAVRYRLPPNLFVCMQALEYNRTFLASRIFMDTFNGNLIISGAFGLFKKSIIVATGGYSPDNLGEDMELILKLHGFCRNNDIEYRMGYQPSAICLTQAPTNFRDLRTQRRRWHIGLMQSMFAHRRIVLNLKFGLVSFFSYLYYLIYELLSPIIEVFGILTIALAAYIDVLNVRYMIIFLIVYAIYGSIISLSAFSQQIYTQKLRISLLDILKVLLLCVLEFAFFRYVLAAIRFVALLRYGKNKTTWGKIDRV